MDNSSSIRSCSVHEDSLPGIINAPDTFKVIVLGETGSGKTSLCKRFLQEPPAEDGAPSTELLGNIDVDGVKYKIEITDTPGCELYIPRMEADVPEANGFILVFSLTSRNSFMKGKSLLPLIWKYKSEQKFPLVIVGNKVDLKDQRVLRFEDGYNLALSWYGVYHEISTYTSQEVKDVFVDIVREIMKPLKEQQSLIATAPAKRKCCCWIV